MADIFDPSVPLSAPIIVMPKISIGSVIFLVRYETNSRIFHGYYGDVISVRKPNAFVLEMSVKGYYSVFIEDALDLSLSKSKDWTHRTRFKPRRMVFRNTKRITIHVIEAASSGSMSSMAERRRAYAKNRKLLQQTRVLTTDDFLLLEIDYNILQDAFKQRRKNVFKQWHPDRSGAIEDILEREEFLVKSKRMLEALSRVSDILNKKWNRIR